MNLRNFLLGEDRITGQMSKAELETFIHEIGRLLLENKRSDYLNRLEVPLSELPMTKQLQMLIHNGGESRGECAAKQRILLEYKAMYSRRSAFHGELR